jgi:hypothetical protein
VQDGRSSPPIVADLSGTILLDGDVSEGARAAISESLQRFADKFGSKVRDVERNRRRAGTPKAEYTASIVLEAEAMLHRGAESPSTRRVDLAIRLVSPISAGTAGIMGSYLHSLWQAAVFGAVATVAVIAVVASAIRAGGK